ncbi:unnamed protein product [Durusdinium trenchii]|uniref:Amino acid transporter n=1 Tax=Durusdinium trenchii TaxID=1381693 RepID=A0ABP0QY69_9DINO
MNVGLLTLPCLFARHGWSAGILMAFAGASCACTALFLQNSIPLPDFPDLAREAIGARFAVLPGKHQRPRLFVAERFQVALAAISDRLFAYCALMSTTSMVAIFASLLLWGTVSRRIRPGILHPLIPCVMHSTRSRHEYRSALRLSWTFFSIFAIVAGGMAFYMIGVDLPAGNGGFKSVLVTAPLLCAVAGVSQLLSPYVAAFESAIGCAGSSGEFKLPNGVITSFNALFFPSLTYLAICGLDDLCSRHSCELHEDSPLKGTLIQASKKLSLG